MAQFYGQVSGSAATTASRTGSKRSGIRASAQTWRGSLIAAACEGTDGEPVFFIEIADGSALYGRTVFSGSLDELRERLGGE